MLYVRTARCCSMLLKPNTNGHQQRSVFCIFIASLFYIFILLYSLLLITVYIARSILPFHTGHESHLSGLQENAVVFSMSSLFTRVFIQCNGCQCWLHQHCIRMSLTAYVECSQKPLQIFCLHCACDGHYNFHASLKRIACLAPDTNHMRDQAETKNR